MKSIHLIQPGRYEIGSFLLILAAGLSTAIVIWTGRQDITAAALLISAVILFLSGILLMIFSQEDSIDERFVSLLQVQGTINLCRVAADLGLQGLSCMVPKDRTGHPGVMHLIPASGYLGELVEGEVFVTGVGCSGMLIPPACLPLLEELKTRYHVTIPDSREELSILFHEIVVDVMEVAVNVRFDWSDTGVRIRMDGYRLLNGCRLVSKESPACCTLNPCVICSLFATGIAEGLHQPVQIERCTPVEKEGVIETVLTFLS